MGIRAFKHGLGKRQEPNRRHLAEVGSIWNRCSDRITRYLEARPVRRPSVDDRWRYRKVAGSRAVCNRPLRARTCPVGSRYSYGGGAPAIERDVGVIW
jgi:hypothetical protein